MAGMNIAPEALDRLRVLERTAAARFEDALSCARAQFSGETGVANPTQGRRIGSLTGRIPGVDLGRVPFEQEAREWGRLPVSRSTGTREIPGGVGNGSSGIRDRARSMNSIQIGSAARAPVS